MQKSTLHAFWQLPNQPIQSRQLNANEPTTTALVTMGVGTGAAQVMCEDCDGLLGSGVGMSEEVAAEEWACWGCGRRVCDACAVAGHVRRCLQCVH